MPCGSQQGAHSPKVSYLYNQEHNVVYAQEFFFLIFKFQCKHSHNYNDVLFHVFADCLMPSPRATDPEHNMRESLMHFIKENREKVTTIVALFLKKKKLSLDEYIEFMSTPGHRGDELTVHLLAIMSQIHYKDKHILQPPEHIPQSISCTCSTCVLREQHLQGYYDSIKEMPTSTLY